MYVCMYVCMYVWYVRILLHINVFLLKNNMYTMYVCMCMYVHRHEFPALVNLPHRQYSIGLAVLTRTQSSKGILDINHLYVCMYVCMYCMYV